MIERSDGSARGELLFAARLALSRDDSRSRNLGGSALREKARA
jgi:hypothetical protein